MARFTVQMTFDAPTLAPPGRGGTIVRLPRSGDVRYVAGDGMVAVTAVLRADTATEAARDVEDAVRRRAGQLGFGPLRTLSWTATRSVPVLAGLRRRRGVEWSAADDGTGRWPDDGEDGEDGGTAGVREPRRPKPSPGAMSAELEIPHEPV
jgi:hypothetical protein